MENSDQKTFSSKNITCSQKDHEQQLLASVCLKEDCQSRCRLLCNLCLLDEHNSHVKNIVNIKQIEKLELYNTLNWPQQEQMKKAIDFVKSNKNHQEKVQEVKKIFENLRENMENKINRIEKEFLIKLDQSNQNAKKICEQLNQKLHDAFSLDFLASTLKKFKKEDYEQEKKIKQLNEEITKFCKNEGRVNQQNEIIQILGQQCSGDYQQFKQDLKKESQKIVDSLDNLQQIQGLVNYNKLKFEKSSFSMSRESIDITQQGIQFNVNAGTHSVVYTESFSKYSDIHMTMKIFCDQFDSKCMLFGVVADGDHEDQHHFWNVSSGNQICISDHENFSRKEFQVSGQKLGSIYEDGLIVNVNIKINENKFQIYDQNKQCEMKNMYQFENYDRWRFIIMCYPQIAPYFEILNIRVY